MHPHNPLYRDWLFRTQAIFTFVHFTALFSEIVSNFIRAFLQSWYSAEWEIRAQEAFRNSPLRFLPERLASSKRLLFSVAWSPPSTWYQITGVTIPPPLIQFDKFLLPSKTSTEKSPIVQQSFVESSLFARICSIFKRVLNINAVEWVRRARREQ